MADLNSAFKTFDKNITLSESKRTELTTSRKAIRDTIRGSFSDKGWSSVKFHMQGSIAMNTAVNPINGDDYDLDDGVYLSDFEDAEEDTWPSYQTAHRWVRNAVEDETSSDPIDKNTCVRIPYKHGYHIDMPIYIMSNGVAYLAHKRDGWIKSDAKEFRDWFSGECKTTDNQLRRIVRYLKRWKDYKEVNLKGIELTILAVNNFEESPGRDDDALRYTVSNIIDTLDVSFSCIKPVEPKDDLLEGSSQTRIDSVMSSLRKLLEALESAKEIESDKEASEILIKVLGNSFPLLDDRTADKAFTVTSAPAVLKRDGRSG